MSTAELSAEARLQLDDSKLLATLPWGRLWTAVVDRTPAADSDDPLVCAIADTYAGMIRTADAATIECTAQRLIDAGELEGWALERHYPRSPSTPELAAWHRAQGHHEADSMRRFIYLAQMVDRRRKAAATETTTTDPDADPAADPQAPDLSEPGPTEGEVTP